MRHHHQTVELRPSSEASPRGLRGITSLHEAPPRDLREITSWPWGTTTIPRGITSLCWGTTMSYHPEVHGIKSNRWGTTIDSPPRGSMELRPYDEAPPLTPPKRVHGIRSYCWGTTGDSSEKGMRNYVRKMRHHHEPRYKGHGIMS